jgi:hypothetical protein
VDFPVDVALAELVPTLPVGTGWRYEMKLWMGFLVVRCPMPSISRGLGRGLLTGVAQCRVWAAYRGGEDAEQQA